MSTKKVRSSNSATQELVDAAVKQGWDVKYTKGGHIVFYPIDKRFGPIYAAATASDHRASKNQTARLRKAGLVL